MEPRRIRLAPGLDRWSQESEDGAQRLVIVRINPSSDPNVAAAKLERLGAVVDSADPGAISVLVTRSLAREVAEQRWVSVVEEPTLLFPEPSGLRVRRP